MLADLVHHIRMDLTPARLHACVHLYARNLADMTLPLAIQTMSAKLLVNLIDYILSDKMKDHSMSFHATVARLSDACVYGSM